MESGSKPGRIAHKIKNRADTAQAMAEETGISADTIRTAATTPASASNDAGSVSARQIAEVIEADRYLQSKAAVKNPRRGLRISRLSPPGSI